MVKFFRSMPNSDINVIVADLGRWALCNLGSKVTWSVMKERFGFSRQLLQAKPEIKAAYDNAKRSLCGGLIKTKKQATKEAEELQVEVERLTNELEVYKHKEALLLKCWQQNAFHIRKKGIQMASFDRHLPKKSDLPSNTESAQILRPFDKEIPPSGSV